VARSTKVLSISVPERLAEELDRMAAEEGVSRSELFRSMVKAYKRERAAADFRELQRRLAPKAQARGIKTEEDVDRIVFEDR
jgi:metal-responsive CopG/Arc/MetJ family transcriptional regulator